MFVQETLNEMKANTKAQTKKTPIKHIHVTPTGKKTNYLEITVANTETAQTAVFSSESHISRICDFTSQFNPLVFQTGDKYFTMETLDR